MIKTLQINESQTVEVNTSMAWLEIYKNQFKRDFLHDTLPAIEALFNFALPMIGHIADVKDVVKSLSDLDSESLNEGFTALYRFESMTFLKIIWSMTKNNDSNLENFSAWLKGIEAIHLPIFLPEFVNIIAESFYSSKNWKGFPMNQTRTEA